MRGMLKVGELARNTGLTVRTLHHYDEIGLLKPSGRSESGYRLYSHDDVARLHAIQALRHLGLPLNDIGALLDGDHAAPGMILEQQIHALDRQIEQASELRGRLALIRDGLERGTQPPTGDWLEALSLMATYGKYFSAAELKAIFAGWHRIEDEWDPLMAEVRALMDAGGTPESPRAQLLARRWMALVHHWMGGDFELMNRWRDMYLSEPSAQGRGGGPPPDMMHFMQRAIDLRMNVLLRYMTLDDMRRIRYVPEREWRAVDEDGRALLAQGSTPRSAAARALAGRWQQLVERLTGGDAQFAAQLMLASQCEPLLASASPLGAEVREFIVKALDPHAT